MQLVFWNDKLIGRHYDEIKPEEPETIFNGNTLQELQNSIN
jgi:hypothetical protein